MQTENRLFDDMAKLFNGLAGTMAGAGREAEGQFRERVRSFLGGSDFVSRDEFEAVKAMAAAARDEVDALRARLDALDGKVHQSNAPTSYDPATPASESPAAFPPVT
ncbi:accessory factor UbiK family protein [Sphingomonas sp.]|uniref:accessory factor UbiK family protein n=1 Tax=Sphingomonas sp. TaxID=28214 RepID=UPI003B00ADDA